MKNQKKQPKNVTFQLTAFVSPMALLKRIRQLKNMPCTEDEDFIEKKLLDSGGTPVFPNQPFKYGYKRIFTNKEALRKNPIGIRSPLTEEELKIVSDFMDLSAQECDTDRDILRILKVLLEQRCNTQNPDELDWEDILTHIKVFLCETKQKSKFGISSKKINVKDTKENEPLPNDLITLTVAKSKYSVTSLTLRRAIAANRLRSYRPKNCSKNHPHEVSESEVASIWPARNS
ncbi:MAG: hypothetical protein ACYTFM_12820 [Planctomycetota bacterium]|jgi:hypothetical protein